MSRAPWQEKRFPAINLLQKFGADRDNSELAELFNVDKYTINRWRNRGTQLNAYVADAHACRLGFHPAEIWDGWFEPFETRHELSTRLRHERKARESSVTV